MIKPAQVSPLQNWFAYAYYGYRRNDIHLLAPQHQKAMHRLTIKTRKKREIVDLTDTVEELLHQQPIDGSGICSLSILHTTAALTTADLDPGTDLDMLDAFEAMIPKLRYRHPHNPGHVPDHILSALIGTSVSMPFQQGKMLLGTWQRIVLVELDGPRQREIVVSLLTE